MKKENGRAVFGPRLKSCSKPKEVALSVVSDFSS
jgi:hypothetical protein